MGLRVWITQNITRFRVGSTLHASRPDRRPGDTVDERFEVLEVELAKLYIIILEPETYPEMGGKLSRCALWHSEHSGDSGQGGEKSTQ